MINRIFGHKMKYIYIFFFLQLIDAQSYRYGIADINIYTPQIYKAHKQNFDILRDKNGFIYSANNNGILKYNNHDWQLIKTKNTAYIKAIGISDNGVIYAGGQGDLGYLKKDSLGKEHFVSLMSILPKNLHNFNEIKQIAVNNNDIYFLASNYIFCYSNGKFTYFKSEKNKRYSSIYLISKEIIVHQQKVGLLKIKSDSLQLVDEQFSDPKFAIRAIADLSHHRLLLGCFKTGFYIYDLKTKKCNKILDTTFKKVKPYHISELNDSTYAVSTIYNGLIFFSKSGEFSYQITEKEGLNPGTIVSTKADSNNNLWVASFYGIAFIKFNSPFRSFGKRNGIKESIQFIRRFEDNLYLACLDGLYKKNLNERSFQFNKVPGIKRHIKYLYEIEDRLLIGGYNAIIERNKEGKFRTLSNGQRLYLSSYFKNRIYYVRGNSLFYRELKEKHWTKENEIPDIGVFLCHIHL